MADTQQNPEPKKAKKPPVAKDAAPKVKKPRVASDYKARLRAHFEEVIRPELTKQFGYKNRMQMPMITKVVLNMGIGEGVADRKKVDQAAGDLSLIAGQKAVIVTCLECGHVMRHPYRREKKKRGLAQSSNRRGVSE